MFGLAAFAWNARTASAPGSSDASVRILKQRVMGNYELNLDLPSGGKGKVVRVFFSADEGLQQAAFLEVVDDHFTIGRRRGDSTVVWKEYGGLAGPPWRIRLLKKGNFFRCWVNDIAGWIRGPLGEWERQYDPWESYVALETGQDAVVKSLTVTKLPWLDQITTPVVAKGPAGSFYEEQAIPGALLEYQDMYYLYFMAGMKGNEEGSSRRSVGVAVSRDLRTWDVQPEPVITYKDFPYDNLYVNGATTTPDGRIAVMFSAQQFPEWKGFMLATADGPLGPFTAYAHNPVYKHFTHAHEFDLVRVDGPDYRYIMFYAGFTPRPPSGPAGDRGYLLFSDDLVHWREHEKNPVFSPQTLDNWDAAHIRPRSLNRIGDTWYLWYEGCNNWVPPHTENSGWWDTIGLARSRDFVHWEYYPRNPALPALGCDPEQFDNKWVGWPRMHVRGGMGFVFYTGGSPDTEGGVHVGLRTIALKDLTNWENEGGETIDLVQGEVR
jgi:predicted GH43/DUF377 family glycosyl hydrolase